MSEPVMTIAELNTFMASAFPQMQGEEKLTVLEEVSPMRARVRLRYSDRNLRPGGTISGPAMMGLADHAFYVVLLAHIGPVALAVTTNLNINFLRKPGQADLFAEARIIKLGKRLAVGEVTLVQDGDPEPVAHVTLTYSIPPRA
ncbi:MAG: PaaI family thioesterase [Parvibaculaceae bacterium]|nr:PaaI family thioesterase [Parvibaculaceae bacterium]